VLKTLLVDGDNLFKIGFHGVKDLYHEGKHIGGLYHFVNTLRRAINEDNYDKVVVFWDGENNSLTRRKLYPNYKMNRREMLNETKHESQVQQRERVRQYLEEMFVRQVLVEGNESDDLIAYYCQIADDENKTIFSSDKDYLQLISPKISVYSPMEKYLYKMNDKVKLNEIRIPHYNIKTYKILSGDKSDNIEGIYYLGEKNLVKYFPELLESEVSVADILTKAETLLKEDKDNNVLKNILTGKTKSGIYGQEFFQINEKIIDLSNPLITDEGKVLVEDYYRESLDPDGRGYKNLIRMMMQDGFFKFLPKADDAWVEFIRPFMKLTRKEKKVYKKNK
jgi:5'-3' exonuclease